METENLETKNFVDYDTFISKLDKSLKKYWKKQSKTEADYYFWRYAFGEMRHYKYKDGKSTLNYTNKQDFLDYKKMCEDKTSKFVLVNKDNKTTELSYSDLMKHYYQSGYFRNSFQNYINKVMDCEELAMAFDNVSDPRYYLDLSKENIQSAQKYVQTVKDFIKEITPAGEEKLMQSLSLKFGNNYIKICDLDKCIIEGMSHKKELNVKRRKKQMKDFSNKLKPALVIAPISVGLLGGLHHTAYGVYRTVKTEELKSQIALNVQNNNPVQNFTLTAMGAAKDNNGDKYIAIFGKGDKNGDRSHVLEYDYKVSDEAYEKMNRYYTVVLNREVDTTEVKDAEMVTRNGVDGILTEAKRSRATYKVFDYLCTLTESKSADATYQWSQHDGLNLNLNDEGLTK